MLHPTKRRLAAALLATSSLLAAGAVRAETIQLDAVHSLTGGLAFLGVPATNAMKLAVDELNAAHFLGNDTLALTVLDDASNTQQSLTAYNRAAIQDKALVILGPSDSTRCSAIAPLLNDLKVPSVTTCQSAAGLAVTPWLFKTTTDPVGAIAPLADYAASKLQLKRVAAVFLRDNDGQISNARTFTEGVEKHGVAIVARESVLSTDTDYAAVATKIAQLKPDGIYIGANAEQAANIVVQLKAAGVPQDVRIFGSSSMGVDYIKSGGKAVDGSFMTLDYNPVSTDALNKKFVAAYRARFGTDAENYAAVGYSDLLVTAQAIKNAGPNPTRERVRDELMKLKDVHVVIGDSHFTQMPNRVPEYGIGVFTIVNGQIVPAP